MSSTSSTSNVKSPIQSHVITKMNPSQELLNIGDRIGGLDSLLIKKSKPFKVGPSSVLDRVKSFLPQMEVANKQLDEKIAEGSTDDLDIENVDDCEGPIIEMNLALCEHDGSSDGEESDEVDDDSDSDSEEENQIKSSTPDLGGDAALTELKLPGRGKKLKDRKMLIEVLPGESTSGTGGNEGDKT